ncbi:hypothetical protein QJ48_13010 [Paenibacillus sp. A3]|uniref:DUF2325 domain-containing protein n=1 Tax=Paenibacillus sp. A3 TaxID=1337054 RepID=UPI0006D55FE5|nr:DUF2325 domain-containing protein [Paenibacillus sp. A3]KPV59090.1 hypothetical protein QJ48_13010 [Paenibacillus sp. A3]
MSEKAEVRQISSLSEGHEEQKPTFMQAIQEEISFPFPIDKFRFLINELSVQQKRAIAHFLHFPIVFSKYKKFPDALFHKLLFQLQKHYLTSDRERLCWVIIFAVFDLLKNESPSSLETFLAAKEDNILKFGRWHVYWALRFHPGRASDRPSWEEAIREFEEGIKEKAPEAKSPQDDRSNDDKHTVMEQRLKNEVALRQTREKEAEQLRKELGAQTKKLEQIESEKKQLAAEFMILKEEALKEKSEAEACRIQLEARLDGLNKDKNVLLDLVKDAELKVEEMKANVVKMEGELEQWKQRHERKGQNSTEELIPLLLNSLLPESDKLYQELRQVNLENGSVLRARIRKIFDLMDLLEQFQQGNGQMRSQDHVQISDNSIESAPSVPEVSRDSYVGTFYRRDHGGYIVLEDGTTFNVTESMVHQHGLEHEAEVHCTPGKQQNGMTLYEIELLLQGDDTYAPVRQFDGYVELGDHFTWYCVDINNSQNRYPLHRRDIEIQQPNHGDPCLFNVAHEGRFARLSRLYRKTKQSAIEQEFKANKPSLLKRPAEKTKPDPFLDQCKIVIVGGLRKWFEGVVAETGAILIHDSGDAPERIHSDLSKADALFFLLTATSHRATWSCVEIAKQRRIPHFVIQGSKSNLRMLLWENRELIKRKQKI